MSALFDSSKFPIGAQRLAIGLLQGLALYLLYLAADTKTWPASDGAIFAPALFVAWFVPVILLLSLGNIRWRKLGLWGAGAAIVVAGVALHDITRGVTGGWALWYNVADEGPRIVPSPILALFVALGLFIVQALIMASETRGEGSAFYPRHFDAAWKCAVQLALSAAFVGVFWAVLWLGAGLFNLIKLDFFEHLIQHRWFAFPASTLAFACALHVTDTRAGIVRGMRTLILVLLSWLLPIMAALTIGFLASLAFTGLEPLWNTRFATSLLLTAAAVLVLLINAAYQDGDPAHVAGRVVRYAGSLASLTLVPTIAIAAYALGLRVDQHGWTTDRIIAAACTVIAACYALGYSWAALSRGPWLKRVEPCNLIAAFISLAILLALFTPLADPARLSVASQLAQLKSGKVTPDKFDYAYLRFQGARYGKAALEALKAEAREGDLVRRRIDQVMLMKHPWEGSQTVALTAAELVTNITVYPEGRTLPATFAQRNWTLEPDHWSLPRCLTNPGVSCEAHLLDLKGDGSEEIVVVDSNPAWNASVFAPIQGASWQRIGTFAFTRFTLCGDLRSALRRGNFSIAPAEWRDVIVGGFRLHLNTSDNPASVKCP
jgi:hypothetical protein